MSEFEIHDVYADPALDPHTNCAGCKAENSDGTFLFVHPDTDAGRYLDIKRGVSFCDKCASELASELGAGRTGLYRGRPP